MPERRSLPKTLTKTSVSLLWFSRPGNDKRYIRSLAPDLERFSKYWFRLCEDIDVTRFPEQIFVPELSPFGALPYSVDQRQKTKVKSLSALLSASENDTQQLHVATVADLVWLLPQMPHMLSDEAAFIAPLNGLKASQSEEIAKPLVETNDKTVEPLITEGTRIIASPDQVPDSEAHPSPTTDSVPIAVSPSPPNSFFLFERRRLKTKAMSRRWHVTPVEDKATQFKGSIPIILMTHQRPGIPQLAVYEPQPC